MKGDMPIHPRFQPLLGRRRGSEGESRRRDRVDESEKCLRMHVSVCTCACWYVCEEDRKCKHCTPDSECEGTMNHCEDKWVKIKRERS